MPNEPKSLEHFWGPFYIGFIVGVVTVIGLILAFERV